MAEMKPFVLYELIPHLHYKSQIYVDVIDIKDLFYSGQVSKIYEWFAFSVVNTATIIQVGIDRQDVLHLKVRAN